MKTSTKLIIITVGLIVIGMIILMITVFINVERYATPVINDSAETEEGVETVKMETEARKISIQSFRNIQAAADWDIEISFAEKHYLEVKNMPVDVENKEFFRVVGNTLVLEQPGEVLTSERIHLLIRTPEIDSMHLGKDADIDISGLGMNELFIRATDKSELDASGCEFNTLFVEADGNADIDFTASDVKALEVALSESAEMEVSMHDGIIRGSITQNAELVCEGSIQSQHVSVGANAGFHKKP